MQYTIKDFRVDVNRIARERGIVYTGDECVSVYQLVLDPSSIAVNGDTNELVYGTKLKLVSEADYDFLDEIIDSFVLGDNGMEDIKHWIVLPSDGLQFGVNYCAIPIEFCEYGMFPEKIEIFPERKRKV